MCGIAGIKLFNTAATISSVERFEKALALQHHRGPDHQQAGTYGSALLGHNRLAIIDPDPRSNQPFSDPSGRYVLVFNGEIYNHRFLKNVLSKLGYRFETTSDTEVLLYWLIVKGKAGLSDLRGCFAFAFYDTKDDRLLLARDSMGINPLLYAIRPDGVYFASELPVLLANGIPFEIDEAALTAYFTYSYVPGSMTMVESVQRLLPGHYLEIKGRESTLAAFWDPKDQREAPESYDHGITAVRDAVRQAVHSQLEADVPLGTFLSGGVDSSIVTALAHEQRSSLQTFSIAFEGNSLLDEGPFAQRIAQYIGTQHTEIRLEEQRVIGELDDVLSSFDEPFADASAIAMYFLARETSRHLRVSLSGDGADELFAGYNKHKAFHRVQNMGSWQRKVVSPLLRFSPGQSRESRFSNKLRQIGRMGQLLRYDWPEQYHFLAAMVGMEVPEQLLEQPAPFQLQLPKTVSSLNNFLLLDQLLVLPGDMLKKTDLMSMRHSLEVRTPFLDEDLVHLVNSLPADWKNDGKNGKRILKDAFRTLLPEDVFNRPKHGFEVPLQSWLRAANIESAHPHWTDPAYIANQGLFQPAAVKEQFRKLHTHTSSTVATTAWAYIVFQHWYDRMKQLTSTSGN